uniref:DNA-directed RNA polymerase subunit beta n=1 Tax=Neobodo designis TaxID=312471 RepID=A0A7S1MIU7_NEODS
MGASRLITPHECRLSDTTYMGEIKVSIEYLRREGTTKTVACEDGITIGKLPIMLRSKKCNLHGRSREEQVAMRECPLDPGGYFIVKGVERVCLVQEQQSKNRIIIESDDHGNIVAAVQSKTHYSISKCSITFKKNRIVMQHRSFTDPIPIVIVLKALGITNDQSIVELIGTGETTERILAGCFEHAVENRVYSQNDALSYIGARRKETSYDGGPGPADDTAKRQLRRSKADEAAEFLGNVLLCHIREGQVRDDWNFKHKGLYVCCMVRRMIEAVNDRSLLDERDFYGNKRFETTGTLMALLFEDVLKIFNKSVRNAADLHLAKRAASRDLNLPLIMSSKSEIIEQRMVYTLSSGNWELKRFNMSRAGVTQVLSRQSYNATLGMMTRLASSFEKTRKISGPRSLQPSQWGMVCPCDTPEGESCGLVKNFALLSQVTLDLDDTFVRGALWNLGVGELDTISASEFTRCDKVFLNGTIVGVHSQPATLCRSIRHLRRSARLHPHVSVFYAPHQQAVHVSCDGGRVVRLYIVVSKSMPRVREKHMEGLRRGVVTISDLLAEGRVEFLDVTEANDCLIAVYPADITPHTTHMEVDPLSLLGVVAGVIPFPHHNQSARNTFQCAMGKQALGGIGYNQQLRADTVLIAGAYPQRPLCRTTAMNLTDYERMGAGINAMVCVMSYSGYDIEDAQVYNRAALDRGYGRCVVLRKHDALLRYQEVVAETVQDVVVPPPTDKSKRNQRFHALDADGIASKGSRVSEGDVLVNKLVPARAVAGKIEWTPQPVVFKGKVPAIVDHVIVSPHGTERDVSIKVVTREVRIPEYGDKFSSRHGQKGVVGLITDGVNLPFNQMGMTPDMIMNPHGFPSRMTVGKLMELMASKAGVLSGRFGDGTAFAGDCAEELGQTLVKCGYGYHGKDVFYSGTTGDLMPAYVFFGPIYYQRLKHMVADKMHQRSTGRRSMLTRQPTEGRAREGGLRIGEMERDCMVGYGAAMLLNERLLISSDAFPVDVCHRCGHIGYGGRCAYCRTTGTTSSVTMPYAFKLLLQEMQGMGIATRLRLDEPDYS